MSKLELCLKKIIINNNNKKTAGKPQVAAGGVNWFRLTSLSDINVVQLHVAEISLQHWYRVHYKTKKCLLYSWLTM